MCLSADVGRLIKVQLSHGTYIYSVSPLPMLVVTSLLRGQDMLKVVFSDLQLGLNGVENGQDRRRTPRKRQPWCSIFVREESDCRS